MKFIFIASILFLTACGDWIQQAPPATIGSGIPIDYNPNFNQNSENTNQNSDSDTKPAPQLSEWGDVRCHSSQVNHFNQQVRSFLSTSFNPNQARYTIKCSPVKDWKGGFFLRGKVHFDRQKFDTQSQNQNLTASQNSYLEIHIVDITGRAQTQNGQPVRMDIDPYASTVQGQNASLVFRDQKGKVFLNGSVEPNEHNQLIFTGTFEFQNFTTWNGSNQGHSGSIGIFTISACHFFECS